MSLYPDIIVFSHLRWNFVYQRPQHLLSRLARKRRVLFIEEPLPCESGEESHWKCSQPETNVIVCRPHTPVSDCGFSDAQMDHLVPMVRRLLDNEYITDHIAWFYTPMALPLLESLTPDVVVYDCMDELSGFLGAPPELIRREAELMSLADVMFTGGPSLYQHKRGRHANVHCYPSSVEAPHFAKAINGIAEPPEQASLPHPRLGFYGVIDERFDTDALRAMAETHPEWQICLVGPVVKIDPASLPQSPNIHYFGQRGYDDLPAFLAGWDVCLLPFARNDATRFISPTKTLEYMAAEKPIVSTPITDVAQPYGEIVRLGETPAEFVAACEAALAQDEADGQRRLGLMRAVLARTSWDRTAASMENQLIHCFYRRREALHCELRPKQRETAARLMTLAQGHANANGRAPVGATAAPAAAVRVTNGTPIARHQALDGPQPTHQDGTLQRLYVKLRSQVSSLLS